VTASVASPFTLPASGLTLTLTANSTVADGAYTVAFQATSGTLSSTASVSLNVQSLASFSFNLLFSSLVTTQGGSVSGTFDMSLGSGNTNFSVSLNVTGLSPGLTATFSPNPLPVTTGQPTVTLTATSSAQLIQNATAQLVATRQSDGARASATFTFTVAPPPGGLPNNRTTFVRTDDTPLSAVYDPTHKLVFAALPGLNRVDAISPATAQVVKSISVPLPQYLDLAPDDSQVIVGTSTNLIFFISTSTLQIVRETFLPKYTPVNGFPQFITPSNPLALPGGDVLINGGSAGVFRWNPATDALTVTQDPGDLGPQWVWTRSLDGTTVLISNNALPGILLLYDPNSNSFGAKAQFNDAPFALAANPNGTRYVAAVGAGGTVIDGIFVLDANLKTVGMLPVGGQIYGIRYSLDGGSIYVVAQEGGAGSIPLIFTISSATLQVVGAAPAYASSIAYFTIAPQQFKVEVPLAVDETGLIIGAADHGMVFDDSTYFQNLSASTPYSSYTIIVDPAEGPAGVSTPVTIKTDTYPSVPDIWFGDQIGSNLSLSGGGQPQATAPPLSAIGPVNVKLIQPSGQVSYIPQGFTYGEIALSPVTLAAGPAGGVTADLFGYGFSVDSTAPNLTVTIGNQAAAITSQTLFPAETPYPFPLQHLKVTVPSGSPGAQNITINSSNGTATIPGGFHFARSVTDYPSPVQFHTVLYDKQRQQLYLSSQGRVDVFSLNSSVYLAPIVPPTLTGNLELWGMALTPDLSRLLVANYADESVAIINPDQPSSAQAVAVGMGPYTIATTNTNQAFIAPANTVQFLKLDLSTLQVSPVSLPPGSLPTSEGFVTSSSDGSKVFLALMADRHLSETRKPAPGK